MDSRRKFLMKLAVSASAPAALCGRVFSEEKPAEKVKEDDPVAVALGYKEDTTKVDKAKYPNHKDDQTCDNCLLISPGGDKDHVPCQAFQNKWVTRKGWCSAWVKKP